jgi:hypothetical protein
VVRQFSFATYVTDAWDEAINRSVLHPALRREVEAAVRARDVAPTDCRRLAQLPDARLYVNPECLSEDVPPVSAFPAPTSPDPCSPAQASEWNTRTRAAPSWSG